MDFITRIGTVSSVSYDKTNEQLLFSLKNSIGQTVLVQCSKIQLVVLLLFQNSEFVQTVFLIHLFEHKLRQDHFHH